MDVEIFLETEVELHEKTEIKPNASTTSFITKKDIPREHCNLFESLYKREFLLDVDKKLIKNANRKQNTTEVSEKRTFFLHFFINK